MNRFIKLFREEAPRLGTNKASKAIEDVLNSIESGEGLEESRNILGTLQYHPLNQAVFEFSYVYKTIDKDSPIVLSFIRQYNENLGRTL
jgi:hypothetical protein